VITSVALRRGGRVWTRTQTSAVKMKRLSDDEVNLYLASGEWQGKAGGYAIQGLGAAFIPWMQGSYTGVMGLPAMETATLLRAAGYRWQP
jgi:septum formation protein